MKICMIASRDLTLPPPEAVALYRRAACILAKQEYVIVTLPSRGGCQLAAASALVVGGTVELLRPYITYEADWVNAMCRENSERVILKCFDAELRQEWVEADHIIHPAHRRLGGTDTGFFACIYGAVEGSDALIVLPHREEFGVEEAPAIRIARALGKPLLVLTDADDRARLEEMLGC